MRTSSTTDLWETVALEAERESPLWGAALRPRDEREAEPVFSPLAEERFALGLETIYEAYLLHYGRPRLFAPVDGDTVFALATGAIEVPPPADAPAAFSPETPLATAVGSAAADCLAHAVLRAVIAADPVADIPTYRGVLPGAFRSTEEQHT